MVFIVETEFRTDSQAVRGMVSFGLILEGRVVSQILTTCVCMPLGLFDLEGVRPSSPENIAKNLPKISIGRKTQRRPWVRIVRIILQPEYVLRCSLHKIAPRS